MALMTLQSLYRRPNDLWSIFWLLQNSNMLLLSRHECLLRLNLRLELLQSLPVLLPAFDKIDNLIALSDMNLHKLSFGEPQIAKPALNLRCLVPQAVIARMQFPLY